MDSTLVTPQGKVFEGMAGAYSALYTPFKKDGSLNEEMIEKVIDYAWRPDFPGAAREAP